MQPGYGPLAKDFRDIKSASGKRKGGGKENSGQAEQARPNQLDIKFRVRYRSGIRADRAWSQMFAWARQNRAARDRHRAALNASVNFKLEFDMAGKLVVLSLLMILVNGCSLSPNYRADGPCKWFHKYPELCESAAANAAVIGKVEIGQTFAEVRKVMERDPERRQASESQESWEYITNYSQNRYATITFVDGKVISIKQ
jgi:hypothetical protein